MARLVLQPKPTFEAKVEVPSPGGEVLELRFTFKHRSREQLKEFSEAMGKLEDVALILEMASGWELEDEFSAQNVGLLVQNYFAAPGAIFDKYLSELTQVREKN